jgi:EpsD family peptidyl-prolyl cis-trans isomerase
MAFPINCTAKLLQYLTSIAMAIALASCSNRHHPQEATQVAAKVGSYEITDFQVDNALARIPNIPSDQISAAKVAALESLVKEQLIVHQAEVEKLDRQPQVLAAIDQARRDVISRAYLAQISQAQTKPSEEEVHQYYVLHPELFSARRIYNVREITTPPNLEISAYLRDFTTSGKTLDQFGQWLQQQKLPFQANSGSRAPESLPIEYLPKLAATKDGGTVVISTSSVNYVAQILSSRPAPIPEDKANPNIQRFLMTQRSKAAIDREIARLRAATKIEYEGEFAKANTKLSTNEEALTPLVDQNLPSVTNSPTSVPNEGVAPK